MEIYYNLVRELNFGVMPLEVLTMYNFDENKRRTGTGSVKWDFCKEGIGYEDVIPLWVADMDFESPKEIKNEMAKRVNHGIFGYSEKSEEFYKSLINWYKENQGIDIKKEWISVSPNLVFALGLIVKGFSKEGDRILIQPPVYHQFKKVILNNNRKVVENPLVLKENKYEIDFNDLENKIKENNAKIFILCNPHNPVGRVWNKSEIKNIIKICKKYNVLLVSDEIHGDLVFDKEKFISLLKYEKEFKDNLIVLNSASKTFNLGGLHLGNIIIPNNKTKEKYDEELSKSGMERPNIFGIVASEAGYKYGASWLAEVKNYIKGNINYCKNFIEKEIPKLKMIDTEATYLIWIDCRKLNMSDSELSKFIGEKAKLGVNDGPVFGTGGSGFIRVNVACPRILLEEAMNRLKKAIDLL